MKNKMNWTLVLVAGVALLLYMQSKKPKATPKEQYARTIFNAGNISSYDFLLGLEEAYLKEWAIATQAGLPTFVFRGAIYNTKGGVVKK